MKNYNKILEAINRGIEFALDDFDNQEDIQGQTNSKVKYQGGMKEYIDLMKEVVDLGLPSGTLWCKYNLGVDSNQLTSPENWYGDYYAWGELEANKPKFSWSTYKYIEYDTNLSEIIGLTKYCENPQERYNRITKTWRIIDNLTELLPEDDAAYQFKKCHNFKFHMPTKEQCEELINYTNNYWVKNYDPNKIKHNPEDDKGIQGLNGVIFEGKNKNQLFIPAAGYYYGSRVWSDSSSCDLWSETLCTSQSIDIYAYRLSFSPFVIQIDTMERYYGYNIRPVINL